MVGVGDMVEIEDNKDEGNRSLGCSSECGNWRWKERWVIEMMVGADACVVIGSGEG